MKIATLTSMILLSACLLVGITGSTEYEPWDDFDDDGDIDIFDIVEAAGNYGESW